MALLSRFVVSLFIAFAVTLAAHGQTWKGPGTDWNTASNWTPATIPNSSSAAVTFSDTAIGTVNLSASVSAQSITFNNTSGNYNLTSGNSVVLSGVSAITVAPNVNGVDSINFNGGFIVPPSSGSLTITNNAPQSGNALSFGASTTINSTGSANVIFTGTGQTTFAGFFSNSSSAAVVKNGPGTFRYQGSGSGLNGGLTLNGGIMQLDYSTSTSQKWANGALTLGGGSLVVILNPNVSYVQTSPGGTSLTGGATDMTVSSPGNGGIFTFQFGAITRSATATIDIPQVSAALATYNVSTTTGNSSAGLLGTGPAYATYNNGNTWATVSGGTITGYSGYVGNTYTTSTANVDVTSSGTTPTGFTVNSLRLQNLISLTLTGTNTLQSGGILDISNINGVGDSIGGGTLTAPGGGEMLVHQYGLAPLTITSALVSTVGLTKTGPGTLVLGGTNTGLTGPINISRGGLTVTTTAAVNSASALNFNDVRSGASLQTFTVDLGNNTNGTITPNVRLSAFSTTNDATVFSTGASTGSQITLGGVISSGTGLNTPINFTGDSGNSSGFNLTNTSNSFTGNVMISHGTLGISSDAALGNAANTLVLAVGDALNGGLAFLGSGITIARPIAVTATTRIVCNGTDSNTISGPISDINHIFVKAGTGTLTLTNTSNTIGGIVIGAGTLAIGANGPVLPAGGLVSVVNAGTQFNLGTYSNSAATALGTIGLNGGTLRVPGGSGDYYVNVFNTLATGGTVDLTGTTNFGLHFVGSGAAINFGNGSGSAVTTLIGAGTSRFLNDTAAPLAITAAGSTTIGVILSAAGANPNFTTSGSMRLTNTGNTANISALSGQLYSNDLSTNVGSGAFGTLGTGTFTMAGGTLAYDGPTATSAKPISLTGSGGIFVINGGTNLTLNSAISQTAAGANLTVYGSGSAANPSTLTLLGSNTYTGYTYIYNQGIAAIPTISNGGTNSPIGASSNSPANLNLGAAGAGRGTLLLTGTNASYSTDRGINLGGLYASQAGGAVGVQNTGTTLTVSGQVTGAGSFIKNGPGTLVLSNGTNNFAGGTFIEAGRLMLGSGTALPAPGGPGSINGGVTVFAGAEFNTGGVSNNSLATAIGTVTLNGGTFRIPSGGNLYTLNQLVTDTTGGTVDMTGATSAGLTFVNSGAAITINGNSSWTGPVQCYMYNAAGAEIPLTIAPTVTVTSGLSLASYNGPFRVTGGGTLYLTNTPAYGATVRVNQARLRLDNLSNTTQNFFNLTLDAGTLQYGGPTAPVDSFALTANGGTVEVLNAATTLTVTGAITGPGLGGLTKLGPGNLVLANSSNAFNGLTVNAGVVQTADDGTFGSGSVTVAAAGTVQYTATTSFTRTYNLNYGTLTANAGATVTMNGAAVNGGFVRGPGTFVATGGTVLSGVTLQNSAVLNQTGPASYVNVSNAGVLSIAAGVTSTTMNGFVNQGSGAITLGATSAAVIADFQTYGTITISPATLTQDFSQTTLMTNAGTTPLAFNGGSRTFLSTPSTAVFPSNWPNVSQRGFPTFVAGIDLNGKNATVAGGLFVNNGYVEDTTNGGAGTATVIADFGSLVKGAGYFQNSVQTVNGGKFQAGNSPGKATFGHFVLGPGGVSNYVFAIDDATGAAGPSPDAAGHVSGWGMVRVAAPPVIDRGHSTSGDFTWTATPADKLTISIETLLNSTTVGNDVVGAMDHFDPNRSYAWPAVEWSGAYAGPADAEMLDASTAFDLAGFANPVAGRFGWALDENGHSLSLTYTPVAVPEPGSLLLTGCIASLGWAARRRRS
jgi:fibronectin-binding autotransporter adhesin